ncbi:MAG: hypothetical protein PHD76_13010 [Methylacidiphilales bacterium]|nr:hypothetical protein [Candidatus Methylacidiphilales bacterium]
MSLESRKEVLEKMRGLYEGRGKEGRSRMVDEVVALCGYSRKHAIKVLGGRLPVGGNKGRGGGPRRRYGAKELEVLKRIWLGCEQPCGKRLKAAVADWLPYDEQSHGSLEPQLRNNLLAMSAATIDRLLAPCRVSLGSRGRCGTRPGTLLRQHIPIRTEHWDVKGPGWLEADTVSHCGGNGAGDYGWSVTLTDVHTQWTENRAVWNRGQHEVIKRIEEIETALPFAILGFDSDNGGEFLNWHLVDYFGQREKKVAFTRSRPYRKNDNARVEQKNWTHVRQLVGYERLEDPRRVEALNDLYAKEWGWFRNFFCPVMKHLRTEVEGSRKKRIYDQAATPYARLKTCGNIQPQKLQELEQLRGQLNPFELKKKIETKLKRVLGRAPKGRSSSRPTGSFQNAPSVSLVMRQRIIQK